MLFENRRAIGVGVHLHFLVDRGLDDADDGSLLIGCIGRFRLAQRVIAVTEMGGEQYDCKPDTRDHSLARAEQGRCREDEDGSTVTPSMPIKCADCIISGVGIIP